LKIVVLMAGDGKRFHVKYGNVFKPFIKVKDKTILERTIESIPGLKNQELNFVIRTDQQNRYGVYEQLTKLFPKINLVMLPERTRGNLETALLTITNYDDEEDCLILDADNAYNGSKVIATIEENKKNIQNFALTCCFQPLDDNPKWCFCITNNGQAMEFLEKDPAALQKGGKPMMGVFYFSKIKQIKQIAKQIILGDYRVNGEFYMSQSLQEMVKMGNPVVCLEVKDPVPLGTPEDVEKFKNT